MLVKGDYYRVQMRVKNRLYSDFLNDNSLSGGRHLHYQNCHSVKPTPSSPVVDPHLVFTVRHTPSKIPYLY